ncbi:polysaccharide pyruvyl transferase family protein [Fusicatenibacter saccharivorans]|uniref:polysaccharide pyruvyl transferase family protein n=1 Tax=Fusicatenibacter saccharivorans TaxID=1150298 RepID=UPI003F926257
MINLYNHGGSGNHGCEAIVRSTVKMLNRKTILYSNSPEQDIHYGIDEICNIKADKNFALKKGSTKWIAAKIATKLTGNIDLDIKFRRRELLSNIQNDDVYLSIGGDNYCYQGTDILAAINRNLKRKKVKTVLWGCSVEPDILCEKTIAEDLASFDLITARESISYEALKHVNPNTILATDPAFTLTRIDLPLPKGWQDGKMIGINASPLILQNAKEECIVFEAYRQLISEILEKTELGIALIPHVVLRGNNDLVPLRELYAEFSDSNRVVLLEDYNCMELKGFIARCRVFIGARTHATIAAYSTCVPTLVLGYSVKSIGIAKDLFGTDRGYVLPVQQIERPGELVEAFWWMMENENPIQEQLKKVIPSYIDNAYLARNALLNIIG